MRVCSVTHILLVECSVTAILLVGCSITLIPLVGCITLIRHWWDGRTIGPDRTTSASVVFQRAKRYVLSRNLKIKGPHRDFFRGKFKTSI